MFSAAQAGGGMKMGQVIGSTDKLGTHPHENRLAPEDLWATVYKHLGIDTHTFLYDPQQRPNPILPSGQPIRELI